MALQVIEVVPIPETLSSDEELMRDFTDRPILRAAIQAKADVLVSGDKDFLESRIECPLIVTATSFLSM